MSSPPRLIEHPPDAPSRRRRNAEVAFEGIDFEARDWPVALAQFSGENGDGNGKHFLPPAKHPSHARRVVSRSSRERVADAFNRPGIGCVAQCGANHRAVRAADKKSGGAADDFTPISH